VVTSNPPPKKEKPRIRLAVGGRPSAVGGLLYNVYDSTADGWNRKPTKNESQKYGAEVNGQVASS
jgi:hypothetical protein